MLSFCFSSKSFDQSKMLLFVKNRDTRCSTKCVKNWTNYNQKPPIGHYCNCSMK